MDILRMTDAQHRRLGAHLHDGSGLEAVAVALCGRGFSPGRTVTTVHDVVEIPHAECERAAQFVSWPTRRLRKLLGRAAAEGLAILKIHSHPTGCHDFSALDDAADRELYDAIGLKVAGQHLSAVMLPDGEIFARRLCGGAVTGGIDRVSLVGPDLRFWDRARPTDNRTRDFDARHRQVFGEHTTNLLSRLSVAVVGVSGTGSPTVEMLVRLGVGRIVLIEFDHVETKNLNRIWGSRRTDADAKRNKARMMKAHVEALGLGTVVEILEARIDTPEAVALVSTCDFVFGCMDSVEGRDALNRIATFYALPYIDMGVRLDADGKGGVTSVSAGIHYLTPGGSSLRSRGVYSEVELHAEYLKRTNPEFYEDQRRRGYVRGVDVERPAVISINTAVASAAVNELLARLHPFRTETNAEFAIQKLLFTHGRIVRRPDGEPDPTLAGHVGRGNCAPLLLSPRIGQAA
jgi:hypothetical protein